MTIFIFYCILSILTFFFFYPCLVAAKRADEYIEYETIKEIINSR